MAAVSTVIILALVVTTLFSDLHPVAVATRGAPLVKGGRDQRLGSDGRLHRSSSGLMQRPRAAIDTGGLNLRKDVGATFCFDLIGRFAHKGIALEPRDFRIDRVVDVLDGGLDACRVVRIEARLDDFVLQGFEAFAGFGERAAQFVGQLGHCAFLMCGKGLSTQKDVPANGQFRHARCS